MFSFLKKKEKGLELKAYLSGEIIDIYVAFDLQKSHQNFDEDEDIELVAYTIEELIEKVMSNEIQDVKTMAAILAYYYKYCNK